MGVRRQPALLFGDDQFRRTEPGCVNVRKGRLGLSPHTMFGQIGKGVEYFPVLASAYQQTAEAQHAEMLRSTGLHKIKLVADGHHVQFAFGQQCDNTKSSLVAEQLEDSRYFLQLA